MKSIICICKTHIMDALLKPIFRQLPPKCAFCVGFRATPDAFACRVAPRRGGIWWCLPVWMYRSRCVKHFLKCVHVVDRRIEDAVGPGTRRGTQSGFWRFAERLKRIFIWKFLDWHPGFVKRTFWSARCIIWILRCIIWILTPPKCARDAHFALAEMHIMDLQNAHFEQFALLKLPNMILSPDYPNYHTN